jgi:hypothetical protein
VETRVGPVFTLLTLPASPLDDGATADPVSPVVPDFISAQPMVKVARPKEAHRNNLENGFIGQAPPQWINKSGNILESSKKNKMGMVKISFMVLPAALDPSSSKILTGIGFIATVKSLGQSSESRHKIFFADLIAQVFQGPARAQGQVL